jgi:hypothetical protein
MLREKSFRWTGRRLVHIFESGWADATCRGTAMRSHEAGAPVSVSDDDALFYVFYYKDTKDTLVHELDLAEYGMTKSWVIVEKIAAADDDDDDVAPRAPETRPLAVGDVVDALWKGGKDYYKAEIEKVNEDGTFGVRYE